MTEFDELCVRLHSTHVMHCMQHMHRLRAQQQMLSCASVSLPHPRNVQSVVTFSRGIFQEIGFCFLLFMFSKNIRGFSEETTELNLMILAKSRKIYWKTNLYILCRILLRSHKKQNKAEDQSHLQGCTLCYFNPVNMFILHISWANYST